MLLLIICVGSLIVSAPMTHAKTPSYAYISVNPNITQVDTSILVTGWTAPVPGSGRPGTVEDRFKTGYVVTFTKPDLTTANLSIGPSYEDGTFFARYTPDQVGLWTVTLYWPGDDNWEAALSPPYTFNVTQDAYYTPLAPVPTPTEYWTRPVPGDIKGMGSYLASWTQPGFDASKSYCSPYSKAPETPHVLWTTTAWSGGITGGGWGDQSAVEAYTANWNTGIIAVMGKVYFNIGPMTYCYDISTGELLWNKVLNGTLTYGFLPDSPDVPSYRGVYPVIYVSNPGKVEIYNALNGELLSGYLPLLIVSTTTDARVGISYITGGSIYYIAGGYITKWNPYIPGTDLNATSSFTTFEVKPKLTYRVQIPTGYPSPTLFWNDIGIGGGGQIAYNLTTGEVMWGPIKYDILPDGRNLSRIAPIDAEHEGAECIGYGKYFTTDSIEGRTMAFDLYTGELVWRTEPREYPYGAFTAYQMGVGQDKVYVEAYDGHVYAYNVTDGSTVWKFSSGPSGLETPYNTWPFWANLAIADGKVYAGTTEHSATNPFRTGNKLYCINDTDGTKIWEMEGAWGGKSIADDKLLTSSELTGELFVFGKGPTAVTVTAPENVVAKNTPVLIKGTVTDQSTGQQGTAAVSEQDMSAWMGYLHLMRPKPTNATGVTVTLTAIASDGSSIPIGTAQSDTSGVFATMWTPPSEGTYRIVASFEGSESYFPSSAETAIGVATMPTAAVTTSPAVSTNPTGTAPSSEAPSTTSSVPATTASPAVEVPGTNPSNDMMVVIAAIAAAVVIIVVAVAAITLRKRKK
jgi:outer membrane protein assembly factor BamB